MSIEIKIPKEINRYEAKAVGPFTLRQLICLLICLPICVGIFLLAKPYVGYDIAGFFVLPPAGIAFLFGWYKPYGLKFEKYIKTMFVNSFIAPSKRAYKTENFYANLLKEINKDDSLSLSPGNKKGKKHKKYKRSKDAIL